MRRFIAILGTLLIAMVITISGSAVATWVYAHWIDEDNTTNIGYIDVLDTNYASLGEHIPPADPVLGWVLLELNLGDEMPFSQDFTVFANTPVEEEYSVWVGETTEKATMSYVGDGSDSGNEVFTTPSSPFNAKWRYIYIEATSGITSFEDGDYDYGPDINAVGWDKP
ncbi:MAG: hypothetical protein JSW00_05270 [Thermoplasmata archaeon]|nr:MAG: hypothetical protein JSW00_05270 [Thermoplasmata archaeon]